MPIDRRQKNKDWNILTETGGTYGRYDASMLAVSMDIRDELQRLNALLHCHNFTGIPATLRAIHRKMPTPRKRVKRST